MKSCDDMESDTMSDTCGIDISPFQGFRALLLSLIPGALPLAILSRPFGARHHYSLSRAEA